jgi:hypothetical protein
MAAPRVCGFLAVHCPVWKEVSEDIKRWKIFAEVRIRPGWAKKTMNVDMTM